MDRDSREENQQKIVEKHQEHDVSKGVRTSRKIEGYKYRREKWRDEKEGKIYR